MSLMLPVPLRTASLNVNFIDVVVKSTSISSSAGEELTKLVSPWW